MPLTLKMVISLSIAIAFYFSADKYIQPKRFVKTACFFSLLVVEFLSILLLPETSGITELGILFCGIVMSLFIYVNLKNYLKSVDIALSIILTFSIVVYLISPIIHHVFSVIFILGEDVKDIVCSLVMQICIIAFGFLLRKFRDFFFIPSQHVKLLYFHLTFKMFIYMLLNHVLQLLFELYSKPYFFTLFSFTAIVVIIFFFVKYTTKFISELEKENRISAIALNKRQEESKSINSRYDEIINFKHYYTSLYKSLVHYIDENDMPGMRDYYVENIAPIHIQLSKEIKGYTQIKQIHIPTLKARLVELINTVSQLPNVEFSLHMINDVSYVAMTEIDLYKIISILIDNAVEEAVNHEKGEIYIEMAQTDVSFYFQIKNTIQMLDSTPKPDNTGKGLLLVLEIKKNYPNLNFYTEQEYGYYVQYVVVSND